MSILTSIISLADSRPENSAEPETNSKKISKFVVIVGKEEAHFVFGPLDTYAYHAGVVKRFCDMKEIPSGWAKKPDMYGIYGNTYRVKGGGWLEEKTEEKTGEKTFRIFGYSTAYGGFDRQDILYLFENTPGFEDLKIEFDD